MRRSKDVPENVMAKLPPRRVADVRAIPGFPYVSDEYAMAIGYVAVFWSLAEDSLAWIIHILIDQYQREAGIAITADLSAVRRIDTITTLMASVRNRAWFDEWCRIADVANDIRTRRNDAVHAVWMRRGADQHTLHAKARGKVRLELKPVSITDLKKPPRPHA
jgi:hypothetical protein